MKNFLLAIYSYFFTFHCWGSTLSNTLDYYNKNAEKYFNRTNKISLESAYPYILKRIPSGSHILDLGSGSGRDSRYFLDHGYKITAVDGSKGLAEKAKEKLGISVEVVKFNDLSYNLEFDAIWASCSLLHSTDDELRTYIPKILASLKFGGIFYASFKFGTGDVVDSNGRFFNFQDFGSLVKLFAPFNLEIQMIEKIDSYVEGVQTKWIHIVLKKKLISLGRLIHPSGEYKEQYEFLKNLASDKKLDMKLVEKKRMEKSSCFGSFDKGVYLEEIDGNPKRSVIRNEYPQLFKSEGRSYTAKIVEKSMLAKELYQNKLSEEISELKNATSTSELIEEFADVLEVLETLENLKSIHS